MTKRTNCVKQYFQTLLFNNFHQNWTTKYILCFEVVHLTGFYTTYFTAYLNCTLVHIR